MGMPVLWVTVCTGKGLIEASVCANPLDEDLCILTYENAIVSAHLESVRLTTVPGRWEHVGLGRDQEEQQDVVELRDDWRWLDSVVEGEGEEEVLVLASSC